MIAIVKPKDDDAGLRELAAVNPEALIPDGLNEAFVGYTVGVGPCVAVYDYDQAVQVLKASHKISEEDAEDFLNFNTVLAYVGPNTPVFVKFTE